MVVYDLEVIRVESSAFLQDSGALRGRTQCARQVVASVRHNWGEGPETHSQGPKIGGQVSGPPSRPSSVYSVTSPAGQSIGHKPSSPFLLWDPACPAVRRTEKEGCD